MSLKILTSSRELEAFISEGGLSVLLAATTSCGPCRRFTPVVEGTSEDPKFSSLRFAKIYLDEIPEANEIVGVGSVPTLILWKDGKEIHREIGAFDINKMTTLLSSKFF